MLANRLCTSSSAAPRVLAASRGVFATAISNPARIRTMGSSASSSESPLASLEALGDKHVTHGLARLTTGIMSSAKGSYVTFSDGRHMLDFTCGIGVTNLGHCHPRISQAAADQSLSLVHGQCSIAYHEPYLRLIEALMPLMPHPSLDSFFFWNSGSEAVEAAFKIARQVTRKQNIIVMQGGYHGRTYGAMAATRSKTIYSDGVAPLMPGVFTIPYPHWHQQNLPPNTPPSVLVENALHQLSLLLAQQTSPGDTAALIIEPVIGEGGYVPSPPEFLRALRDICDKWGILLIVDEVQCGFGRAGKMFFVEESGIKPDILLMAKGLANGFPLSAVVSRKEITDKLKPGSMGGTYAGNAVACAAAVEVARIMGDPQEGVLENVRQRSSQLFAGLKALAGRDGVKSYVLDVRGAGLMVAVEFASPVSLNDTYGSGSGVKDVGVVQGAPKSLASRVSKRCGEKGLLLLTTSVYEVVRFIPPLNITEAEMQKGIDIFAESLEEVVREG